MATTPLPQGMSEEDYEAIEAAVAETVRGRWFLNEFARRTRAGELRKVLDVVTRLERTVEANAGSLLPAPADPSIRLLMQRIREISGQLGALARDMDATDVDPAMVARVEEQARAVSGMLRSTPAPRSAPGIAASEAIPAEALALPPRSVAAIPSAVPSNPPGPTAAPSISASRTPDVDPRIALLSGLDGLPVVEKLALFA